MSSRRPFVSGKRWSIATLSEAHQRIAIDANILIYVLEGVAPLGAAAQALLDAMEAGTFNASLATIGQLEILTGPARREAAAVFEETAEEIRALRLRLVALDPAVAEDAAWLRGQSALGLADAVHLASARAAGATAFVTNDRRIRSRPGLEVVYLDEIEAA
jgi:predicted nucleic acid-binding protein